MPPRASIQGHAAPPFDVMNQMRLALAGDERSAGLIRATYAAPS